ncbi:MAG: 2-oxoglutarate dehydrogenase E1 component [Thermoanaerobaculia bacterium]|nr:2-oxoglutarate dehydrogenase E1 component [Thermoanaerobaculia bacterium]
METAIPPRTEILDRFRRWGYLQADLDPLGRLNRTRVPELDELDGPEAEAARRFYCGSIGVEFMHIPDPVRRRWVAERMEGEREPVDPKEVARLLLRGEQFEQTLQSRYLGSKRFSIEGVTALLPALREILVRGSEKGAEIAMLGMSHRGRLTAKAEIVGVPPRDLFAGFEDLDPRSVLGAGDVKYHLGATGEVEVGSGRTIRIHLASNPSHLESVNPVVMGRTRAKQLRVGESGRETVLPILVHGDSAFAGQGILAETLNMADLAGYSVGGSVQIVANNLIGFTTEPGAYSSSRFATDVAKRLPIPIFHVNGEDPDAVVRAARMALDFRYRFGTDVVLDIIGYRRHGHSEIDDPTITQPQLYARIEEVSPLWESYAEEVGLSDWAGELQKEVREELSRAQKESSELEQKPKLATLPDYWDPFTGGYYHLDMEVDTGLSAERLASLSDVLGEAPEGFHLHDKQARLLEQRREMGHGDRPVDFGTAEAFAFASLLAEGTPVRLTGQDSRRGTFNQRHAVLVDEETTEEFVPLAAIATGDAFFEIYDSPLSEAAPVAYEYGVSRDYPEALVLWEAQFGDFANGAQVPIDQFVVAGEDKWNLLSGLVLLLPHGYEGQGPEHSSARLERYLQLAAEDNIQVCVPSTAAQYFHLLRRQALRSWRKPMVVLTPKSMLRHKRANSELDGLTRPRFLEVVPDRQVEEPARVIFCSGKIGHELAEERERRDDDETAIVFLDQLYPFPRQHVSELMDRYGEARDLLWVQEEPANQGALFYVVPRLEQVSGGRRVRTVKRRESASPATGSAEAHKLEQKTLLQLAFERLRR